MNSQSSQKRRAQLDQYQIIKTLGSGYNAKVKLGFNETDGQYYALKIALNNERAEQNQISLQNESKFLQKLKHPHIVNLTRLPGFGQYISSSQACKQVFYCALEYACNGELFECVAYTGNFNEVVARTYFHQIISALEYLHQNGITHRDIKPENILLDENYNAKIADFGFSAMIQGKEGTGKLNTVLGTESYMAPEIHLKLPYSGVCVDLFSAGIILFIMYTGCPPFSSADPRDPYFKQLCTNHHDKFWNEHLKFKSDPDFFSSEFVDLMNSMLAFDPTQRLSLSEIKAHPWYQGETTTVEEIKQEFNQRIKIVQQEIEKERLIKQLKKQQQNQQQQINNQIQQQQIVQPQAHAPAQNGNIQNQQQQFIQSVYTGIAFRGLEEIDEQMKMNGKLQQGQEDQLRLKRNVQLRDDKLGTGQLMNEHFSLADVDYLFKYLTSFINTAFNDMTISDSKYKIKCKSIQQQESSSVQLSIRIVKVDDDVNCVEFQRESGPMMEYFNQVAKIKACLDKLKARDETQ